MVISKTKRAFSLLLALLLVIGLIPIPRAYADDLGEQYYQTYANGINFNTGTMVWFYGTDCGNFKMGGINCHQFVTDSGAHVCPVYCFQPQYSAVDYQQQAVKYSTANDEAWQSLSEDKREGIARAMFYGYPVSMPKDDSQVYQNGQFFPITYTECRQAATQCVIFEIAAGYIKRFDNGNFGYDWDRFDPPDIMYRRVAGVPEFQQRHAEILANLNNQPVEIGIPSFANEVSLPTPSVRIGLEYDRASGLYTKTVTDTKGYANHFDFASLSGNGITVVQNGDTITVSATQAAVDSLMPSGSVHMTTSVTSDVVPIPSSFLENVRAYGTGLANKQNMCVYIKGNGDNDPPKAYLALKVVTGNLEIQKATDDGSTPAGYSFTVTGPNGYQVTETTDSDGKITLLGINPGEYTIFENEVPARFKNPGTITVFVQSGATAQTTVNNILRTVNLVFEKRDADSQLPGGQGDAITAGAVYGLYDANDDHEIARRTMEADSTANFGDVGVGSYYFKEITPPTGYRLSDEKIPFEITMEDLNDPTFTVVSKAAADPVIRGGIEVQKHDTSTGAPTPQGNGSFEGIEFTIYNRSAKSVFVNGEWFEVGDEIAKIYTDSNGYASTAADLLPYGTYEVKETNVPANAGYENSGWSRNIEVRNDEQLHGAGAANDAANEVYKGTVNVQKLDADTNGTTPQGEARDLRAKIAIINKSNRAVTVNGTSFEPDQTVFTIETNSEGFGTSGEILPYGSYELKEIEAPNGYVLNENWSYAFSITSNGQVIDCTSEADAVKDNIIRGGFSMQKVDKDTGLPAPQGNASFEDTSFTVYNASEHSVVVNGNEYAPGEAVMAVRAGADNLITVSGDMLPYGKYKIKETSVEEGHGYLLNEGWEETFTISENGAVVQVASAPNIVIKGGVKIQKVDSLTGKTEAEGDIDNLVAKINIINRSDNAVFVNGQSFEPGEVVYTITTNAAGYGEVGAILPFGKYEMVEAEAPEGYLLNRNWHEEFSISADGEIVDLTGPDHQLKDIPVRGGIEVQKHDADTHNANPQGNASFEGIVFAITNASDKSIVFNGEEFAPGDEITTITTDSTGKAKTAANALPYGTYTITEKSVPASSGYKLNESWSATVEIRENGHMYAVEPVPENHLAHGAISIQKFDGTTPDGAPQGGNSLAGAEIQIISNNDGMIIVNGEEREKGDVVYTLITDRDGFATTPDNYLPFGVYTLKETVAPEGYAVNTEWSYEVSIEEDGRIYAVDDFETGLKDSPVSGSITVYKVDAETGEQAPLGAADFEGAEITVLNRSNGAIVYNDELIEVGEVVDVMVLDSEFKATIEDLPYGSYELYESKAPEGYKVNEGWHPIVKIEGADQEIVLNLDKAMKENVIRNDILFQKVDGDTMERLALVPFRVTSKTTGESHIIVTDANGIFNSSAIRHSQNTNGNDAAVNGDEVDVSLLDPSYGVWFSGRLDQTDAIDNYGAFPYDTYVFEELVAESNAKMEMVTFEITVYQDIEILDIGTVDNYGPTNPYITTKLTDRDTGDHIASAVANLELVDEVSYSGLQVNTEYRLEGQLLDQYSGEVIATASATFTPTAPIGTQNVSFNIDASEFAGKTLVATQILYQGEEELYVHDNIYDEEEMVRFPAIGTNAHSVDGEKEITGTGSVTIVDTVTYKNLIPNISYVLKGKLVDKSTGDPIRDSHGAFITAQTTFKPESSNGTIDMTFTFDISDLNGMTAVVFEELSRGSVILATHEDLEDSDQTVCIPSIGTTLTDSNGKHTVFAGEDVELVDVIRYSGLTVGKEYTATGTLMNQETGEPVRDADGNVITAEAQFTPTANEGTVEVVFHFNGSDLAGIAVVAFEEVSNGVNVCAEHKDLNDEEQTVYLPAIGTTAVDKNGNSEIFANGKVTIIDTVEYSQLIPGTYTLEGKLYDKRTGEPVIVNGSEITDSRTFTTRTSSGSERMNFVIDNAEDVAGMTLVVFEYLYNADGELVAEHADIDDVAQTVNFPKIGTSAAGENGSSEILAFGQQVIVDTVTYENLIPGNTYTMSGKLIDKATGRTFRDASGADIIVEKTFVADENGTVEIQFVIDAENLAGKTLVVFEQLLDEDSRLVAKHEDVNDEGQTVTSPKISTAVFGENNEQVLPAKDNLAITDYITFSNLKVGETYTLHGYIVDKESGEALLDNSGNPIEFNATMTPSASSGVYASEFTIDATNFAGRSFVVFEEIYNAVGLVAEHKDINDKEQSFFFPGIGTSAADRDGNTEFNASGKLVITDTVSYKNLLVGKTYKVSGYLVDKETGAIAVAPDGQTYRSETSFKATSTDGQVTVQFTIDSADWLEGKTLVVFETLYLNDEIVAQHEDIDDAAQTVTFPKIRTSAATVNGGKEFLAADNVTLVDTVTYENLIPGNRYVVQGKLVNNQNGKVVRDADGNEVVAETSFVAQDANGTVEVEFVFNASAMAGKTLVVFEELHDSSDRTVAKHANLDDQEQTITFPKIRTMIFGENNNQVIMAKADTVVTDYIEFENLVEGHTYFISGVLMDKETGNVALDSDGNEIVAEARFTASSSNGVAAIEFSFDASQMGGKVLVAFETISDEYGPIAEHKDLDDQEQTLFVPTLGTNAADKDGNKEILANGKVSITDTVSFTDLQIGLTYKISGVLMDKETGEPVFDANGNQITAEKSFKATAADGTQSLTFAIDNASILEGKTLVVFETLYLDETEIAAHADIDDEAQTVTFPKIRTMAVSDRGTKEFLASETVNFVDTVSYENLVAGETYTLQATLVDKATGRTARDADGNEITAELTFTAQANGTAEVRFSFDGSNLEGKTLVVFETLKDANDRVVGEHKDLNDTDQTITIPKIGTMLFSDEEVHVTYGGENAKFVDYISFENLVPGHTYKIHGMLVNKQTGEIAVDAAGNQIVVDAQFTAQNADGVVEVPFIFDGSFEDGITLVAFEYIYDETDTLIAKHEEITDAGQTGFIPSIRTTATDKNERKEIRAESGIQIIDTISYKNLMPGARYTVTGVLMDKETGLAAIDATGNRITVTTAFTPEEPDGTINVVFRFDGSNMAGKSLVAFETITLNGVLVADHKDLDDLDQTINFPAIATTAHDENGSHEFLADGTVTIIDTVEYENLTPGTTYTLTGTLMDKNTRKPVKDVYGDAVTSTVNFIPATKNGSQDVEFTFDVSGLKGKTVVAYEALYDGEYVVARHQDINDDAQTITFPEIRTTLQSEAGTHVIEASETVTVTDTVVYKNLIVGREYVFEGTLADENGQPILDANGEKVTATVLHTPEAPDGSVDLVFEFDSSALAGTKVVAFEQVSNDFGVIAKHEDLSDEDQTGYIPKIGTRAAGKDGEKEFMATEKTIIVDTVSYESLKTGERYTMRGTLVDKDTGEIIAEASKEFVPRDNNGEIQLTFVIDSRELAGHALVAFEELVLGENVVAEHKDLNDADQTVSFPKIGTTAHNENNDKEFLAGEAVTVIDTVHYENLTPGAHYVIYGELRNKANGKVAVDAFGDPITGFATLDVPAEGPTSGDVDVVFTFYGTNLKNMTLVAYEELHNSDGLIAKHADLDDEDQTITFPEIGTTLADENAQQVAYANKALKLIDTVTYSNLVIGREYTVEGILYDKSTGEPIKVVNEDGEEVEVKASAKFTAHDTDGSVNVTFTFDATNLVGTTVVAFEYLSNEFGVVAVHEDIDDEKQTSYLPHIGTTATDPNGAKDAMADEATQITDVVEYTNLQAGKEYKVVGTLYVKETGEPLTDANGDAITVEAKFKPKTSDGSTTVTFTCNTSEIAGKSIVVFEEVYLNGVLVAEHRDIQDEAQTIHIPLIQTEAMDEFFAHVTNVSKETDIVDRVEYTNLIPGEKYEMVGTLYLKSKSHAIKDEFMDVLETRVEFVPDEANGYIDVPFTVNTMDFAEDSIVAFEVLYHGGREVAHHTELNDESQTIHFPNIRTTANFENGTKTADFDETAETVKIVDTVEYVNLVPGLTYKVSGSVMDKKTGGVLRNADGEAYVAELEFVPESANGSIDLVFEINGSDVFGKTVVVFENLLLGSNTIAVHADLNDAQQTISVPYVVKVRKINASNYEGLAGAQFKIQDNGLADDPAAIVDLLPTVVVTSDEEGYVYFNALPGHEYSLTEIVPPDNFIISLGEHFVVIDADGNVTGEIEIANVRGGSVVINKTDVITGDAVPGCEITVYKEVKVLDEEATQKNKEAAAKKAGVDVEEFDGEYEEVYVTTLVEVFKQVTDEHGRIYFYTDEPGTYHYRETATVDGYYLNEDDFVFEVNERQIVSGDINIENVPFGTVVLTKIDTENRPLKGAEFAIYDEYDRYLGKGVTDAKGRVYFVSPGPGRYYFVEVKAPEGYQINSDRHYFTISSSYAISGAVSIVNGRTGGSGTDKTGDNNHVMLWVGIGGLTLIGAATSTVIFFKKKRKEEEEGKTEA